MPINRIPVYTQRPQLEANESLTVTMCCANRVERRARKLRIYLRL